MTIQEQNMSQPQHYIGVDLGAESGRVMLAEFDGAKIKLTEMHRFATGGTRIAGSMRWDVLHFWKEIVVGLRAVAAAGVDQIRSIGVDAWGVDYVLLDENDELLGLPRHYRDERKTGSLGEVTAKVPRAEIFAQTGIQFIEINTLYQLFAEQKCGSLLSHAKTLLTIPDFFHWCLCGVAVTEFTNATTTQCFDPTTGKWASSMLKRLGIPDAMLPATVQPGDTLGDLRESLCMDTGLPSIPVVAPATHDTGSAVAAVPVDRDRGKNWAYISSGTWSLVGVETTEPILTDAALELNVTNEGGVDGTWRLLKNVMGLWLVQGLKASYERAGESISYDEITRQAAQTPALQSFVNPDHPSFANPPDMMQAVVAFCQQTGQDVPGSKAAAVRCVLESLALKYRGVLDSIAELSDREIEVIHVVGGGSRNGLLNQFIAFACNVPVIAGPVEATVMGNVLVQCRAAGQLDSLAAIRDVVRNSIELVQFDPEPTEDWADAYVRFNAICEKTNS